MLLIVVSYDPMLLAFQPFSKSNNDNKGGVVLDELNTFVCSNMFKQTSLLHVLNLEHVTISHLSCQHLKKLFVLNPDIVFVVSFVNFDFKV